MRPARGRATDGRPAAHSFPDSDPNTRSRESRIPIRRTPHRTSRRATNSRRTDGRSRVQKETSRREHRPAGKPDLAHALAASGGQITVAPGAGRRSNNVAHADPAFERFFEAWRRSVWSKRSRRDMVAAADPFSDRHMKLETDDAQVTLANCTHIKILRPWIDGAKRPRPRCPGNQRRSVGGRRASIAGHHHTQFVQPTVRMAVGAQSGWLRISLASDVACGPDAQGGSGHCAITNRPADPLFHRPSWWPAPDSTALRWRIIERQDRGRLDLLHDE
jgi:hypothetical protein